MGLTHLWFVPIALASIAASRWLSGRTRATALLAASLAYYALTGAATLAVVLAVVLISWMGGAFIAHRRSAPWIGLWVFLTLIPLLGSKYLPWLLGVLHGTDWWQSDSAAGQGVPTGLSFVSLQAVGFLLDVGRGRVAPIARIADHTLFLTFFPQMGAGPIERAESLVPQLRSPAKPSARDYYGAAKLFLWGYSLKLLLADQIAAPVAALVGTTGQYGPAAIVLALLLFSLQLFCDFYGYSCIAVALGKAHGVKLTMNFAHPYGAVGLRAFWHRWHVSLSRWWRDYVYVPIGGSRRGWWRHVVALACAFLLSGIWHGAGLGFVLWGAIHGALILCEHILRSGTHLAAVRQWRSMRTVGAVVTFVVVTLLWLPFLASPEHPMTQLADRLWHGMTQWRMTAVVVGTLLPTYYLPLALGTLGLLLERPLQRWYWDCDTPSTTLLYTDVLITNVMLVALLLFGDFGGQAFIYFAF